MSAPENKIQVELESHKQAKVDLHGLNATDAETLVCKTIKDSFENGISTITVITGIGNHVTPGKKPGALFRRFSSWLMNDEIKPMIKDIKKKYGSYELQLNNRLEVKATSLVGDGPCSSSSEACASSATESLAEKKIKRYDNKAAQLQWEHYRKRVEKEARKPIKLSEAQKLEEKFSCGGNLFLTQYKGKGARYDKKGLGGIKYDKNGLKQ